ncbi:hypothetical protein ANO11243_005490 [Dothideomycetidae sp. 11243]|nr:hypothetical protein ANO11243_005490 [fungal sp. No.11243]
MHSISFIASALSLLLSLSSPVAADLAPFNNSQAVKEGIYGNYTRQSFLSSGSVIGPVANVIVHPQEGVSPSKYVTWAPGGPMLPSTHPMLIDANNFATIWAGPVLGRQTMGPLVQSCNGSQYLTWWAGDDVDGYKQGRYYMVNEKYEIVYNVTAVAPLHAADAHELFLTPECTAIITVYETREYDLSYYNITDGWLMDSYFQEIDLATGELLFQWQASEAMNITMDIAQRPPILRQGLSKDFGHDWFHINSVAKDHLGNYLISSRHACTVYYISGLNGAVIWRLGGPNSDFKDMSGGKATDFSWQHHARWLNDDLTRLSLYDDRSAGPRHIDAEPLSRGIIVELDYAKKEVRLDRSYYATRNINSDREGSMQVLTDSPVPGNVMLGYGQEPAWTEFAPNGTVLLDVAFGPLQLERMSADNYRALKVNWTGLPFWGPSIAHGPKQDFVFNATTETFSIRLFDDWNGATEIKSWIVLASNDTTNLTVAEHFVAEVPKLGFEEHVFIGANTKYAAAFAVNGSDFVLGATNVLDTTNHALYIGPAGHNCNDTELLTKQWRNTFALLFLLTLCALPAILYFRGRRQQYVLARTDEFKFSDELHGLKGGNEGCFDVGLDGEDDDDDNNSERTYYDEPFYPNKGSLDHEGDLSTLRSSSSCTSKEQPL